MAKENEDVVLDEQMSLFEEEQEPTPKEEIKQAAEKVLSTVRRQSIAIGAQVICQTVLDKIVAFENTPGNKSNNDHKRLIKEIKRFVETGLSKKVETIQN